MAEIAIAGVGKPISRLALGTAFYRLSDEQTCHGLLDRFAELGGTLLDTARDYGESEAVLGRWLTSRGARERVAIITKGGQGRGLGLDADTFADTIHGELTLSLETLCTDYVDLYVLHRDSPDAPVPVIVDALNAELVEGRVRALGASNWAYDRLEEANAYAQGHGLTGFAAVSDNLSLAVPTCPFYPGLVSVDEAGERWHQETGIPLIPWSAQARGFSTGRYAAETRDDHRSQGGFDARMVEVYCTDANSERFRRAQELGDTKGGRSATEIALAWLLHRPFPVVPIVGPHSVAELESCFAASAIEFTDAECAWLSLSSRT